MRLLIEKSSLASLLDNGNFTVNAILKGTLAVCVLSPLSDDHLDLGRMNAAYDRPGNLILLQEDVLPSLSTLERWAASGALTSEERASVRFCQFLLLHELGHRAKGSLRTNRFYFAGSWMSDTQIEELNADRWAMAQLFSVLSVTTPKEKADAVRELAGSALRAYFGKHNSLIDVPTGHPSMFYRIGSLYEAAAQTSPEGQLEAMLPELTYIRDAIYKVEDQLAAIVSLPDAQCIEDVAAGKSRLFVLSNTGNLYGTPIQSTIFGDVLAPQDSSTVRRYSRVVVPSSDLILSRRRSDLCRIVAVGDDPFLVTIGPGVTKVEDASGKQRCSFPNPAHVLSTDSVPIIEGAADEIQIVFREKARVYVVHVNYEAGTWRRVEFDLQTVAPDKFVDVVGLRGNQLLVHAVTDLSELWALSSGHPPEFISASVIAHLFEPTLGLIGLGVVDFQSGQIIDFRKGQDCAPRPDGYYLGRLTNLHRMIRFFSELDSSPEALAPPLEWISGRSTTWVSVVAVDHNPLFDTSRLVTTRRGLPELYILAPKDIGRDLDLVTAAKYLRSISKDEALEWRNRFLAKERERNHLSSEHK